MTPEIQKDNNPIYNEALDYAYSNPDIKNIAITEIYGAGKSTVWNTYVHNRDRFKNNRPITVSLGLFEDENLKTKNEYQKLHTTDRIEKQIINQILSQVDSNKTNESFWDKFILVVACFLMIVAFVSISMKFLIEN